MLNTFLTSILYFILLNWTHYQIYKKAPYTFVWLHGVVGMVVLKSILCAVAKIAGLKRKEKHNLSSSSSSSLPKACILKNWNFIFRAIDLVSRFPNAGVRVRGHFWILRLYLFFCSLLRFFQSLPAPCCDIRWPWGERWNFLKVYFWIYSLQTAVNCFD